MTHPTAAFGSMLPGFDFMQGLVKNAGAALPGINQWIAPTLDPEELDKRIKELKTVQFWLEQNARLLATTIQALEVQRMTLSTLKGMNVSLGDLAESLKARVPGAAPAAAAEPAPDSAPLPNPFRLFMPSASPATAETPAASAPEAAAPAVAAAAPEATVPDAAAAAPPGLVDPMQWWTALTQQFTELAQKAVHDGAAAAAAQASAGGQSPSAAPAAASAARKATSGAAPGAKTRTKSSTNASTSASTSAAGSKPAVRRAAPKRGAGPAR